MSIQLRQVCDGCKNSRTLDINLKGGRQHIDQAANEDGWKEVTHDGKHLCGNCIKGALS